MLAVLLLAIGCVLLFANRLDPLAGGPPLDPGLSSRHPRPPSRPGSCGSGSGRLLATPVMRVIVSLRGFIIRRERTMSVVAAPILVVIGPSIVLGHAES